MTTAPPEPDAAEVAGTPKPPRPERPRRFAGIHPLFFAIWPVLFLWSQNLGEVDPVEVVGPLLVVGAVALVATFLIGLLFRDVRRAALIVSATVVVVLMYGHVLRILPPDPIPDRFQKAAMAGCIVLAVLIAWRLSPRILGKVDTALTRVSLILVAVTLIMIVPYQLPGVVGRPMVRPVEPAYATSTTAPLRDVYYLIFDRYGSDASLLSRYGKQNDLTPWLREQGFTVLDDSHANYVRTGLSLASTLNITHLDDLAAAMGPDNTDQAPFRSALASSVVAKQMQALGYTYHHLGTWWNPSAEDPVADVNHRLDSSSDFASVLFETSALPPITTRLGLTERTPSAGTRNYENGIFEMDTLDDLVDEPGPKFVFAHVLLPHPPLTFDSDGSYLPGKAAAAAGLDDTERWERQLAYTNTRIKHFFEGLLALPEAQRPIIILQADEGPYPRGYGADRMTFDWATATPEDLTEKFGIINAWYLPGGEDLDLYPSMTSINTFPTLFTNYFGLDYERLPDKIQSSKNWHLPYDLLDITDRVPRASAR